MNAARVATLSGSHIDLNESIIQSFRSRLKGPLLRAGDAGYDEARTIWNAMIDRRPALISQCTSAEDVQQTVNFAREHGLLLAMKGGGHNIAGNAVCDSGLMIDFSKMNSVRVDEKACVAHVGPGATLGDFDREAQKYGLATPVGINSTTGVAGLTLGGGFGWLSRKHGMTVDNLLAVDVVAADGRLLKASERENADLFWALRGGGGNFGVVTRFEFKLHPLGPDVASGLIVFALSDAVSAIKKYRDYVSGLSEETSVWFVLRKAPPLPFLPAHVHGTEVIVFAAFHAGDPEAGKRAFEPIRGFGKIVGEFVGVQPYVGWQSAFDPLLTPGARNYWKSHNFEKLSDGAADLIVEYADKLPSDQCEIFVGLLGGATGRVAPDAMAYSHRNANFVMNVHGRWTTAAEDEKCIGWAREFYRKTEPHATGGVYVNFLTEEETGRIKAAYGKGYDRLVGIKKKYDPDNLFRMNQNINPAG